MESGYGKNLYYYLKLGCHNGAFHTGSARGSASLS